MWVGSRRRDLGQHRQHGGGRRGPRAHGRAELAQEQDRRRLAGVVGGLPVPGALGVGAAEGGLHRVRAASAHRCAGRARDGEGGSARPERARRPSPERAARRSGQRRGREGGRGSGSRSSWREPRESRERVEPTGRSLSTPPAQTRPGHPLPLTTSPKKRSARRRPADRHSMSCAPETLRIADDRRPIRSQLLMFGPTVATGRAGAAKEHGRG